MVEKTCGDCIHYTDVWCSDPLHDGICRNKDSEVFYTNNSLPACEYWQQKGESDE